MDHFKSTLSRRQILKFLSASYFSSSWLLKQYALAGDNFSSRFFNDLNSNTDSSEESFVDNDEYAQQFEKAKSEDPSSITSIPAIPSAYSSTFLSFHKILSALSPELENKFDVFIFVNTSSSSAFSWTGIPGQTMTVIGRKQDHMKIFARKEGQIIGFTDDALDFQEWFFSHYLQSALDQSTEYTRRHSKVSIHWKQEKQNPFLLPISSGQRGKGSILTFSGVFQLNWDKIQTNYSTSLSAPMSHALYINYRYGQNGTWSGVAIHGTPPGNWSKLGITRASHGCVRTLPYVSEALRGILIDSTQFQARDLPALDPLSPWPRYSGKTLREMRPKALIVIFDGY